MYTVQSVAIEKFGDDDSLLLGDRSSLMFNTLPCTAWLAAASVYFFVFCDLVFWHQVTWYILFLFL